MHLFKHVSIAAFFLAAVVSATPQWTTWSDEAISRALQTKQSIHTKFEKCVRDGLNNIHLKNWQLDRHLGWCYREMYALHGLHPSEWFVDQLDRRIRAEQAEQAGQSTGARSEEDGPKGDSTDQPLKSVMGKIGAAINRVGAPSQGKAPGGFRAAVPPVPLRGW